MKTNVDATEFKEGMRLLAGAVTIVTTGGENGTGGFTATAVCSVSDTPPTLLVCVNKGNELLQPILQNGMFAVNILPSGLETLSNRFAGFDKVPMPERLKVGDWEVQPNGLPTLKDSLTCFTCSVKESIISGTHCVVFGLVDGVFLGKGNRTPLLYFDRGYASINT